MKLHEHDDFAALITAAAAQTDLEEAFVEKDYWITEILRVIARTLPGRAIFKGGTSLSKGWNLLDRFSEDIDLFVDPAVEPALSARGIDRTLKRLRQDAIHGKIERLKVDGHPLGRDARHYADIFVLASQPEVLEMLGTDEYELIRMDYDEKSRAFFPDSYRPPPHLRFAGSDALFPSDALRAQIEPDYEQECARLFHRPHPPFAEVLRRLEGLRDEL